MGGQSRRIVNGMFALTGGNSVARMFDIFWHGYEES